MHEMYKKDTFEYEQAQIHAHAWLCYDVTSKKCSIEFFVGLRAVSMSGTETKRKTHVKVHVFNVLLLLLLFVVPRISASLPLLSFVFRFLVKKLH